MKKVRFARKKTMKKTILLLSLFLSTIFFAQTNVSGGISSNTTWSVANSPYIVTGDMVVFESYTLNIEPGVTVKFDDDVKLIIRGNIVARGNSSNNIIFTSNNSNPQKGSWNRIEFDIRSSFNFDYVTFEYANNCMFYMHPSSGNIKNSIFQNNNNGINRDGYALSTLNIENTKFINNDIGITEYLDEVNLKNCEFKNNRIGANITDSNIDSCLFEGNTELGLEVWSSILTNSTFINNGVGLEKNFNTSFFPSKMTGNTIKNNKIGIKVGYFSSGVDASNNTIYNNSQYDVVATESNGVDFSNNCWGTEDLTEIENRIYHGIDDISIGLVNFGSPTTGCPDTTIDVAPVLSDQIISTDEDINIEIDLTPTDPDSNQFTYTIVSLPSNGDISIRNNIATYTSNDNFNGDDSFTVTANDGGLTSNLATISITVNAINDAPIAKNNLIVVNEGATTSTLKYGQTTLLYNDYDVEDDSLTTSIVSQPVNGSLTLNTDGTFSYEHDGSETTYDSFTYKINDGDLDSSIAFVIITIDPTNDNLPTDIILSNNSIQENRYLNSYVGQLYVVDLDLPSDSHTYELVSGIGDDDNSSFSIISGRYLYTNDVLDYEHKQSLSIRIKATDENNQSFEKLFTINIVNVNDISIVSETTNSYCSNISGIGSITITSVKNTTGTVTYNWFATNGGIVPSGQENSKDLTELVSGTYHLSVSDDNFTYNDSFEISLIPQYNELSICYVSSDDLEVTKNRIYLNNQGSYNVAFYEILRESNIAGIYTNIGTISSTENTFLDNNSNNLSQSYNYKVRLIDNCGNTTLNSDFHKTILLQSSVAVNKTVNLNWSNYQGREFSTYNIYRNTNNEGFQLIGSVSSNSNSFNDTTANVADNDYEYYIAISVNSCLSETADQSLFKTVNSTTEIKSNYQKVGNSLSMNDLFSLSKLSIYPNPASSQLNIKLSDDITFFKAEIYNAIGQMVMETKKTNFLIEKLSPSTYFIKISTSEGVSTTSFIKQ